jgi:transcriptional regulator of arginine metabolism
VSAPSPGKRDRQDAILALIKANRVDSQEVLRELLAEHGIEVAQATLSRDIRDLRLVKVTGADGGAQYTLPEEWENSPPLETLLPTLMTGAEASANLLVVRTLNGGAQAVAGAIDWEEWPEVLGTIAGDDTILLVLRDPGDAPTLIERLDSIRSSK